MKSTDNTSQSIFLTGFILLANLDFTGLLEYGLKAAIGGGIWLAYKLVADQIDRRKRNKTSHD
ncbi:MAG: hypothetical protein J0H92_21160 [Sphingobacteriales bacterium]|nr:hypothetical protein [Sphingobacteriales bacterium]OJW31512.1 MAG: hypothetical protein BGO54_13700 [Sphingobacteriales bacterium 46-32]